MRHGVNILYQNASERFATRVVSDLGDAINAVVLFGSVARKQAKWDSDIDVLVIGPSPDAHDRVIDIAYDVMEAASFEVFISVVYVSRNEFRDLVRLGSPLVCAVLERGRVLYDDGTFAIERRAARMVGVV